MKEVSGVKDNSAYCCAPGEVNCIGDYHIEPASGTKSFRINTNINATVIRFIGNKVDVIVPEGVTLTANKLNFAVCKSFVCFGKLNCTEILVPTKSFIWNAEK